MGFALRRGQRSSHRLLPEHRRRHLVDQRCGVLDSRRRSPGVALAPMLSAVLATVKKCAKG